MKKRILSILLAAAMMAAVTGCDGKETSESTPDLEEESDRAEESSDNTYDGEEITLVMAHHLNDGHVAVQMTKEFAELVSEKSGGKITIEVHGNSEIGNQMETAEAVRMGTIDLCINDFPTMATVYPKADIVALPYMFNDWDHVAAFYDSEGCVEMIDDMANTVGVRVIGPAYDAFRAIYSQKKIETLEDVKGLKIRVPDIPLYVSTFEAMGCQTTIVAYSEIYTALQTGVVNALENSHNTVYTSALYEQTKYIAQTNHIFCDCSIMANEAKLNSIDPEAKAIVLEAAKEAAYRHRQRVIDSTEEYKQLLLGEGMEYTEVEVEPFREACVGVWEEYENSIEGGAELIDYVQSLAK
ncbi:MAG: TRAP transporter substrate-binding protein [Lachnospiraceae bacterium]|jgi:tripartite ATP-independent transporter DctP family solute receptor|nr:TRAP transporter substrate-binding protein [Lachnospiraceae bacterium]MCI9132757.1 TRAP transporter substrate-binding protein [Lachnospiraceae bacterium]